MSLKLNRCKYSKNSSLLHNFETVLLIHLFLTEFYSMNTNLTKNLYLNNVIYLDNRKVLQKNIIAII